MTTGTPTAGCMPVTNVGATIPFDAITTPGAYVCDWSGHLLRVPEEGVSPSCTPMINIIGNAPLTVTKISDNPFLTISKAKLIASNYHLNVDF